MPKKNSKNAEHFTSFRIIGEKAQKLLARARDTMQKENGFSKKSIESDGPTNALPEMMISISIKSVALATLTILGIVLGVFLLWLLQDKLILMFLGLFVAVLVDPGVRALKNLGVPRGLGILIHFFVALFLFAFLVVSLIPIVADQLQSLAFSINQQVNAFLAAPKIWLPLVSEQVNAQLTMIVQSTLRDHSILQFTDALRQMGQDLSTAAQGSFNFAIYLAGSVFNFFVNLVVVLVLAFFLQLEKEDIMGWARGVLPWSMRSYMNDKTEAITWKLGQWVRGQLLLCLSIGVLVFLALLILRMPYALTLALLAGFTEFIPVVGPFIAMIPAVLIGLTQNGLFWGLVVAAVYYVIQWCENNLLVPLIMKRTVGLSPTVTMFAMMVGVSFPSVIHPILGIILSIPLTTILAIFLEDWSSHRRRTMAAH